MALPKTVLVFGQQRPMGELDGGRFYHGSCTKLPVGTILTPGHGPNFLESDPNRVSITSDRDRAQIWAQRAARFAKRKTFFVYEVEPQGEFFAWRTSPSNQGRNFIIWEARVSTARILAAVEIKLDGAAGEPAGVRP